VTDPIPASARPLYAAALAGIHDAGFAAPAREAAALLLDRLCPAPHDGLVLDLGCGSGAAAETVAAAGFRVLGIDPSPAMVQLARARVPSQRFEVGSIHDAVPLPACDAVLLIGEVVNYAGAGEPSLRALAALLDRIASALVPGGLLLMDAAGPGRAGTGPSSRTTAVGADLVTARVRETDGWLDRFIEVRDASGTVLDQEHHRLRLMDPQDVEDALERAGFVAQRLNLALAWTQGAPAWNAWLGVRGEQAQEG
jgi:SAM-dependent methyltransferase